jgi:hypothetical protein
MAFRLNPPQIKLDQIHWEETGDDENPRARLLAHIQIGPVDMHLEAWEVDESDGDQCAVPDSMRSTEHELLCGMMDCTFSTIKIEGRTYVLVATPYGS